jgi:hypothetical protein
MRASCKASTASTTANAPGMHATAAASTAPMKASSPSSTAARKCVVGDETDRKKKERRKNSEKRPKHDFPPLLGCHTLEDLQLAEDPA